MPDCVCLVSTFCGWWNDWMGWWIVRKIVRFGCKNFKSFSYEMQLFGLVWFGFWSFGSALLCLCSLWLLDKSTTPSTKKAAVAQWLKPTQETLDTTASDDILLQINETQLRKGKLMIEAILLLIWKITNWSCYCRLQKLEGREIPHARLTPQTWLKWTAQTR